MRRTLFGWLAVLTLALAGLPPAAAAQETADPFADLGLPVLEITITNDGYEGLPAEIAAGRYLLDITGADDLAAFGGAFDLVQPVGITAEELIAFITMPMEAQAEEMHASPEAGGDAGADSGGEMGGAPAFIFDSLYAGGTAVMAGQRAQLVVDLPPGAWVVSAPDPEASQQPLVLTATGEMPADLPEPASDATITMGEYTIEVTDGVLAAGPQVIRVDNIGAQPHFLYAATGPDGLTADDVGAVLQGEMTGTPAAVDFNPETDLAYAFSTGNQSTGTTQWLAVDLQPGTYVMVCFFPDQADMLPHAYHGMYAVVEVAG